jgi:Amt family ammonium transporter
MLGPRSGRVFGSPPKPHNLGLATLGTMILWFGWYGFNPGSTLGVAGYEGLMGLVTVNTTIAAGAALLAALAFVYFRSGKWDISAALNGSLAGLVGITAPCGFVSPMASFFIGITAGVVVILATDIVEKAKIDDCVGAFPVHGACGILGTIALGLWAQPELTFAGPMAGQGGLFITGSTSILFAQIIGSASVIVWTVVTGVLMFGVLKAMGRLRIPANAEAMGIDVYEHGTTVWPDILPVPGDNPVEGGARAKATAAGD